MCSQQGGGLGNLLGFLPGGLLPERDVVQQVSDSGPGIEFMATFLTTPSKMSPTPSSLAV